MHACADAYVAVDATEWLPLNLFLLGVDLDGHRGTCPLTVLALVALHHIEADLAPGSRDDLGLHEWVRDSGWLAEEVLDNVAEELWHFRPSPSRQ